MRRADLVHGRPNAGEGSDGDAKPMTDEKPKGQETSTGRVLEEMVLPALRRAGYTWQSRRTSAHDRTVGSTTST